MLKPPKSTNRPSCLWIIAAGIAIFLPTPGSGAARPREGYRIYISVDMEGIAGAATPNQIQSTGTDYQQSRGIMTAELLAAIAGAREAGATQFVVSDSHSDGQNILIDQLPDDVTLIRGEPRPLAMMEGVQNGHFDGAMFIGYHASASSSRGVRAHSFSSARLSELRLNGVPASEGYVNAAIAGHFNVPVILMTGDDAAVEELQPTLHGAQSVVVKHAIGFHSAAMIPPQEVQRQIHLAARRAVEQIGSAAPVHIAGPITMDVTFHFYRPAEMLAWLPFVERTGARSVRYQSADAPTAMRILEFMTNYEVALEP
jgi:D-amino peptidase